jgi:hypothetical protein
MRNLPSHIPIEPKNKKKIHPWRMDVSNKFFAPSKIIVKEKILVKRLRQIFSKKINFPISP